MKTILDACCGSRMFWFDRHHPNAVYMDNRTVDTTLCDGRPLVVAPDVVADFRDMPFEDSRFRLVVFDPPHLIRAGENSWTAKKYGVLAETWTQDIYRGFTECMRVLKPGGVLVFKWNEDQIKLRDVLNAIGEQPLFGDRRAKTHWLVFMKEEATHLPLTPADDITTLTRPLDGGGNMLTDIYVRDKSDGHIRRVGDDRHDSLLVRDGVVCYYNLQTGCGTLEDGGGEYEFVDSEYGEMYGEESQQ